MQANQANQTKSPDLKKLNPENQRWMEKSRKEITELHEAVTLLKQLSNAGYYVEVKADNHTVFAGQEMIVGFVVGDLTRPSGNTGVLKNKVGTPMEEVLKNLRVLCGIGQTGHTGQTGSEESAGESTDKPKK